MTVADWCIPGAVLIYLLTIAWAKASGGAEYRNAAPRDPAFYAAPLRARALGAHQNGIEAFPFFAVAVVFAEMKGGPPHLVDALAVTFLALRVGYVVAYIT